MHNDLEKFYKDDSSFRVCNASQGSTQALSVEEDLKTRFPDLQVKRLIGLDSGLTKKEYFEDISKPLESTNACIYIPVLEAGVDITISVKKLDGVLPSKSNSQRAYMQMLARCRNVEDSAIDVCNDPVLKVNSNHNFLEI